MVWRERFGARGIQESIFPIQWGAKELLGVSQPFNGWDYKTAVLAFQRTVSKSEPGTDLVTFQETHPIHSCHSW